MWLAVYGLLLIYSHTAWEETLKNVIASFLIIPPSLGVLVEKRQRHPSRSLRGIQDYGRLWKI